MPVAHGNTANKGFARYFADTLPRVLPVVLDEKDRAKAEASRKTFWEQIDKAAGEADDPALVAVAAFGRSLGDAALVERIRAALDAVKATPNDRVTFAWQPGTEATIMDRPAVRQWYRAFYQGVERRTSADGAVGLCQVTGTVGPIPRTHPIRLSGIPGGLPTGTSLISFDKDAFGSYGLDGAANAGVGERAAEGYARALKGLIEGKLPGSPRSRSALGARYSPCSGRAGGRTPECPCWRSRRPRASNCCSSRLAPGRRGPSGSRPTTSTCSCSRPTRARVIVRDYLETPLPEANGNLARWFRDLRIATWRNGETTCLFPLWQLTQATAMDNDHVGPDTPARLLKAALGGGPVSRLGPGGVPGPVCASKGARVSCPRAWP